MMRSVQHHQSTRRRASHRLHLHQLENAGRERISHLPSWMPWLLMILLSLAQFPSSAAFVVPNELPSILSLVYSNIPVIKKGTDSRIGFGFRLGEHADFQLLTELGPQKETRPIGDQDKSDGSAFNKRQVNKSQQRAVLREDAKTEKVPSTWLEKWATHANASGKKKVSPKDRPSKKAVLHKPDGAQMLPPQPPQLPSPAMQQLQLLYKMATSTTPTEEVPSIKESTTVVTRPLTDVAALHLQERLKILKAPGHTEDLQVLMQKTQENKKAEVTKQLMDVSLDE